MVRGQCLLILLSLCFRAYGQTEELNSLPKKGSYLYYGQPAFEDNSFLMEEAINQDKGVMQYISDFYFDNIRGGNFLYSFNQEIPITHLKHQLNYTIFYHVLEATPTSDQNSGFGDINVGYRYMVFGKKDWAMVVPGITLILPTGKSIKGQGIGGVGGQVSLAITKRLSHKLVTHYNFGYTFISQADRYTSTITGTPVLSYEKDLRYSNLGVSIFWYPARKFNLFTEFISNYLSDIKDDGSLSHTHLTTINPGFRFAIDHKFTQIVPGISLPVVFTDGNFTRTGIFFYLSIEPEYLPFTKSKHR